MIEVEGYLYRVTHLTARTYSVRTIHGGQLIGMFMLELGDSGAHVFGAEGRDVGKTLRVAKAALAARVIPV